MAFTQTDLDAINAAIARGESVVRFADRTVEYRSIGDLIKARNLIVAELNAAAATGQPRRFSFTTYRRE